MVHSATVAQLQKLIMYQETESSRDEDPGISSVSSHQKENSCYMVGKHDEFIRAEGLSTGVIINSPIGGYHHQNDLIIP